MNKIPVPTSSPTLKPAVPDVNLRPRSIEEALKFAAMLAKSDLVPTAYKNKPENIFVAVQMGAEVGLSPMQAIQNIAVINGRPALWGDAMLALVLASPLCEYVDESESTDEVGVCIVKRKGDPNPTRFTFTEADAIKAGLVGKAGPWTQYKSRMKKLRARGFGLRDKFPDVLRGLCSAEEQRDMVVDVTPPSPVQKLKERLGATPATPATSPPDAVREEKKGPKEYILTSQEPNFVDAVTELNAGKQVRTVMEDWRIESLDDVPETKQQAFISTVESMKRKQR